MLLKVFSLCLLFNYSNSFIVPQEVPSLLSLVYSNIPPIRKGSDSRYGVGFRLGEHADFQVLLELGPQRNTRPIGANAESTSNKREANPIDLPKKPSKASANNWLTNWSQNTKVPESEEQSIKSRIKPFIADDALRQLQKLYGKTTSNEDDSGKNIESLGTLSATALENDQKEIIPTPTKLKIVLPDLPGKPEKTNLLAQNSSNKNKSKITADLMDVSLD
jgi:hypothetical protein